MKNKTQKNSLWDLSKWDRQNRSGGAFTAAAVLPVFLSLLFVIVIAIAGLDKQKNFEYSDWYLYVSYLISPVCFCIIAILLFTKTEEKPKEYLSAGKGRYYFIAILLQFGLFSLSALNGLFLQLLEKWFGYQNDPILLPNVYGGGIVGVTLVVALLPAIFEELFFRGILLKGLKEYGVWFSALVCGGLFSLFHQNPAQTVYQFVCGVLFALVAIKSGSIFPTVISHFLNNVVIILLYRFGVEAFSTRFEIPFMICSGLALCLSCAYLFFFDRRKVENPPKKSAFFLYACGGIALMAISWISVFFSGV